MSTRKYGEGAIYPHGWDSTNNAWVAEEVEPTGQKRALVYGEDDGGVPKKLRTTTAGLLKVETDIGRSDKVSNVSPFGDQISATRFLMTHAGFNYPQSGANINSDMYEVVEFNPGTPTAAATVEVTPARKVVIYSGQAGAATGSLATTASIATKRRGRYVPGFGLTSRFTALFSATNASCNMLVGMGTNEDAITVGYPSQILTTQGDPNPLAFAVGRASFVTGTQVGTYVTQGNFNVDNLDGTGPSGMVLDTTKGNVFQIDYQWLGFGGIFYYVEDPLTCQFVLFHRTSYTNAFEVPSTANPNGFGLFAYAQHTDFSATPAAGCTVSASSMSLYSEGVVPLYGPRRSITHTKNATSTVVLAIRVSTTFPVGSAYANRQQIRLMDIDVAKNGGSKTGVFQVVLNPTTLPSASWSAFNANTSVAEVDTTATTLTGGTVVKTTLAASNTSSALRIDDLLLVPGDVLAVTFTTTGTAADADVALNWIDLF